MPALSRLRLLRVEPSGGDRLPELRLRRDGGEAVQGDGGDGGHGGHGGHAEVPEVRTRSDGGGGGPGGAGRDLTAVVVGGGLAGGEAAWALAERGVAVTLREMRPVRMTAAHQTDRLAELVCSNSFKSVELTSAHGLLKAEMRRLGSLVLEAADAARVPGGAALAVDRVAFADHVQRRVSAHPKITGTRDEATALPSPGVVATGPLTSEALARAIAPPLHATPPPVFDALAPLLSGDSLDPHAVVQLRQEDRAGQMWNLVGFQTRLKIPEQQRVLRLVPGLERAEFLRYGSIHRNSYINSPRALSAHLAAPDDPLLLFAGQLTGVEGYTESAATGILAGVNLARLLEGEAPLVPPPTTMLGALYRYVHTADPAHFQPMNANFGLLEPLDQPVRDKARKKELLAERALAEIDHFAERIGVSKNAECGVRNAE